MISPVVEFNAQNTFFRITSNGNKKPLKANLAFRGFALNLKFLKGIFDFVLAFLGI